MLPKEALKQLEQSKGRWTTVLATTPIVMTVFATVFAGLSSSEMTQAMFHRSLASQQQSKAGDQWAFFQAKRIRGTTLEANIELLQSVAQAMPLHNKPFQAMLDQFEATTQSLRQTLSQNEQAIADLKLLREKCRQLMQPETEKHWITLMGGPLPEIVTGKLGNADQQQQLEAALSAIAQKKQDEIYLQVKPLFPSTIETAIQLAEQSAERFSQNCEPVAELSKELKKWLVKFESVVHSVLYLLPLTVLENRNQLQQLARQIAGGKVAIHDFDVRRYREESTLNKKIAEHYELLVWRSGMESDRHRKRSQLFFYSMLVAQVGVTISSLALAQAKRSALWYFAALAGLIALGLSAWVYLTW